LVLISAGLRPSHPTNTRHSSEQPVEFVNNLIPERVLRFHIQADLLRPNGLADALRLEQKYIFKINSVV
jgi:hypothetical protein